MSETKEQHSTIYINNLNDKVKIDRLKETLYKKFRKYGNIIQLSAHKNLKMKGQCFITYDNAKSAEEAIKGLAGEKLYKKELQITHSKEPLDEYYIKVLEDGDKVEQRKELKRQRNKEEEKENKGKEKRTDQQPNKRAGNANYWQSLPPNHTLLIQNLKEGVLKEDLEDLFEEYDGFNNLRFVKVRNLAFIDFDNEILSKTCLESISLEELKQKFGNELILSFAKK
ncbi:hypothetical protein HYPBUDRAFT_140801 [Hyphopichia burtonii NRRL Y-1933]|uniref:RRM domain-containing protein n=1 Tax=Hyphopichia burtonii NRRL Y-1933 TaxID=984485 RepID=A0A1E4RGR5_9ASCO|nr:hypothetical protein HYPBUDRAFT_140801 [Hyphopichia burtonii NRRL Y-1933]ODV66448.1 hypothetical protein HYPBUDRAFT_140801 [Hyphopichia burtonii NRRL Y-1933]